MKIGYLGPEASYTHIAAKKALGSNNEFLDCKTISDVIDSLKEGNIDLGILPVENSIEGGVAETVDAIIKVDGIYVINEFVLPIKHNLLGKNGLAPEDVSKIYAHPMSFGQCREFIRSKCPNAEMEHSSSNSAAAKFISEVSQYEESAKWACIAADSAAEIYDLNIISKEINDEPNNETRFWIISQSPAAPSSKDKTSIVFQAKDEPGSLVRVLQDFADSEINLSRIESRPSKKGLGEYLFYVDLNKHKESDEFQEVIKKTKSNFSFYKWLGSYSLIKE